jgi:ATP synthase F1 subcomplex alpha subunit
MQQLNPSEISELIRARIAGFEGRVETRSQGTIISLSDGILRIHGLEDVMYGEMLELPGGRFALAMNLEQDNVGAVVLGEFSGLEEGGVVKCTGRVMQVPIGKALLGRVVNALGQPIDGKGPIETEEYDVLEKIAPGVVERQSVDEPMQTGIKAIDAMVPIGRGQRELIIGDRRPARPRSPSMPSSIRKARMCSASMSPSVRRLRPSLAWCASSRSTARWSTPR